MSAVALGVCMGKGGRPRSTGPRYPSGDLKKPKGESITPAAWGRIKQQGIKTAHNERLASEVGRLSFHGELTNNQAAAAFRIGDAYRRLCRLSGIRTQPKSPSFEAGRGNSEIDEERMSVEEIEMSQAAFVRAQAAWDKISDYMATGLVGDRRGIPFNLREAVMDVCVFDRPINPLLYPDLRFFLDEISKRWTNDWGEVEKRKARADITKVDTPDGVTAMTPRAGPFESRITESLAKVIKALRPDLDERGVRQATDTFQALRQRAAFRSDKAKRR